MGVYERLSRRAGTFQAMTGHTVASFGPLYEQLASGLERYEERQLNERERQRAIGAGSMYRHDSRDRLLMALIWLRVYPTYDVLGFIFDLDKSNICRNLKPVLAVLSEQLGSEINWPDKSRRQQKRPNFSKNSRR